jgi:hypothetical protein
MKYTLCRKYIRYKSPFKERLKIRFICLLWSISSLLNPDPRSKYGSRSRTAKSMRIRYIKGSILVPAELPGVVFDEASGAHWILQPFHSLRLAKGGHLVVFTFYKQNNKIMQQKLYSTKSIPTFVNTTDSEGSFFIIIPVL